MTTSVAFAFSPLAVLLGTAFLVLILEAAGTPIAARKVGTRGHLTLLVVIGTIVALFQTVVSLPSEVWPELFIFDDATRRGAILILVFFIVATIAAGPSLRDVDAERGEAYASMIFVVVAELCVVFARDLTVLFAAFTFSIVAGAGALVVDRKSGRGAEAAAKHTMMGASMLVIFGLGAAIIYLHDGSTDLSSVVTADDIGALLVLVVLLESTLAFPLHVSRIDVLLGGPSVAGAVVVGTRAIAAMTVLSRLLDDGLLPAPNLLLAGLATISLVAPGLVALDQREVPRAATHLFVAHGALAFVLLVSGSDGRNFAPVLMFVVSLAALGTRILLHAFRYARREMSWEAFSGIGRRHPVFSIALTALLSVSAFFPGMPGLWMRLLAADAFIAARDPWGITLVVLSAAVVVLMPLRLGLFMFAKASDPRAGRPVMELLDVLVVVLIVLLVAIVGVAPGPIKLFLAGGG